MEKLKFEFVMKNEDKIIITSITTIDDKTYKIPEKFQAIELHKDIMKTEVFKRIVNSLQKPNDSRKVRIKSTRELSKIYLNENKKNCFKNFDLKELTSTSNTLDSKRIQDFLMKRGDKIDHGKVKEYIICSIPYYKGTAD